MQSPRVPARLGVLFAHSRAALPLLACLGALTACQPPVRALAQEGVPLTGTMPAPPPSGQQPPPRSEEELLMAALRYLKVDRTQLALLRSFAQSAAQRRAALEAEQLPTDLRNAPALPDETAEQRGERLRREWQNRIEAHIGQLAAESFTRLLTREQIALAVRLVEGNPPTYAKADAGLLNPDAGFSSLNNRKTILLEGAQLQLQGELSTLGGLINRSRVSELNGTDLTVTMSLQDKFLRFQEVNPRAEGLDPGMARIFTDLRRDSLALSGRIANTANYREAQPFAQRVIEAPNVAEFVPMVEPLARRLFGSPAFPSVIRTALTQGTGGRSVYRGSPSLGTLRQARVYDMERGLRDLTGNGPALEPLGGVLVNGRYFFQPGQGLRVADAGVTDQYAFQFTFSAEGGDGYQKLVDFRNGTRDLGLYLYQGRVTFYTLAVGGVPQKGREHRIRLERNRQTRIVRGYLDTVPIFAFIDLDEEAVFDKGQALLFMDDRTTQGEQGPGSLRSAAFWSTVRPGAANRL